MVALWLDLIPKLHRADGHDDNFDQLRDTDEDRDLPLADDLLAVVPPPSPGDVKTVPTGATSTSAAYSARKLFLRSPPPTSVRSTISVDSRPADADGRSEKTMIAPRAALAATLAIGCLALVVNCVIFVVVYRRRVNLKRLPPNDIHYPSSPSVNVVGASKKTSATDGRYSDGVGPRSRYQQSALYVSSASADDVDDDVGRQDQRPQPQSPAGRQRSTPPPPPPPPSTRPSTYSPRCVPDGCLLRRAMDNGNHVAASTPTSRTSAPASDVWVQLTTHWLDFFAQSSSSSSSSSGKIRIQDIAELIFGAWQT